jgi:hypothetical protein
MISGFCSFNLRMLLYISRSIKPDVSGLKLKQFQWEYLYKWPLRGNGFDAGELSDWYVELKLKVKGNISRT